ncbi:MAG: SGNH/GDSL hydrolase family protein [bacterium]
MKKIRFTRLILLFLMIILAQGCSSIFVVGEKESAGIIDADNPNIQYVGRFDFTDPKKVGYDWPGIYICAKFEGTSCAIRLSDYSNEYAITIDNMRPKLLKKDSSEVRQVASGLDSTVPHTIKIQKRTESFVGKGEFLGFILDDGKKLLPPDSRPERRIEFIGNSITSGYGVEGEDSTCHFSPETENACMSYASITARELKADYSLISYSGRGVVRNYGDVNKTSPDPMPYLYDRICFNDSISKWDFSTWIPQAVVINLGTNDFSTEPYPDKSVFQKAYLKLINRVRALYPGVTIFCVCGPMIEEPCLGYIKEVIEGEQKNTRDKDIFFIVIQRSMMTGEDWGCDFHPNIKGMNKISKLLAEEIQLRMNW